MLELRPTCENCHRPLPPEVEDAMIRSLECTLCADCIHEHPANVCPNCGGRFKRRPVRPSRNWKGDNFAGTTPSPTIKHRPVNSASHAAFAEPIVALAPARR